MSNLSAFRMMVLVLGVLVSAPAIRAEAPDFGIERVALVLHHGVYELDADLRIHFSNEMHKALLNGVALPFQLNFELTQPRRFIWDSVVASLNQEYVLSYHALSGQYILENLNTEQRSSHRTLFAALESLGHIVNLPVLDEAILEPEREYIARVRIMLDDAGLPLPLRVKTYLKQTWNAKSPWVELSVIRPK